MTRNPATCPILAVPSTLPLLAPAGWRFWMMRVEAYTRGSSLQVNADGMLVTGRGELVLDQDGVTIAVPEYEQIQIGPDGTISILGAGDPAAQPLNLGRMKLALSDAPLKKGTDGLFRADDNQPLAASDEVKVQSHGAGEQQR